MSRTVKRAFKYRFYPTPEQAAELARTFGCVRLVYNMALQARSEAWTLRQERVNYNATSALLTGWKRTEELAFLNEVSSVPLQQALRHLQVAFKNFFAKWAKYPTFKSKKRSRRSVEYTSSAFRYRDGRLTLAKMTEPLEIVWSRSLPEGASPSTVTVSQDSAGRWFVSLHCDDVIEPALASGAVGVDAGLEGLLTLSTGEKVVNPKHEHRDRAALARAQRALAPQNQVLSVSRGAIRWRSVRGGCSPVAPGNHCGRTTSPAGSPSAPGCARSDRTRSDTCWPSSLLDDGCGIHEVAERLGHDLLGS
ncbi:transposase [Dactylosporangium sp. NPDC049742]|uniref:RNA-guided endonuclease InsQ/TnpB family protein n=1 Tax=Dactylosporangium sp. NPDC049742 TaxID=3154737 RepID=UPI00343762E1